VRALPNVRFNIETAFSHWCDSAGERAVLFLNQQFKNETISDENIDKIIKSEGNLEKKCSRFPGEGQKNQVFHRNSS
jgi:hypothetical protein